jgi:NitT/TauT family transport system ATP-binding protein
MSYKIVELQKSYDGQAVLDRVSLSFTEGGICVILGPSGCGKTTLLNVIAGLAPFESGGRSGFEGAQFSYAFQEPRLLPWLSARDNILFALKGALDAGTAQARADEFLGVAGLSDSATRRPSELSGGMRQRLSLARAFAYPADILLLDEAFQSVDLRTKIDLMDAFLELWRREKPTVISVTHDIEEAVYLADRVVVLSSKPAQVIDDFKIDVPRERRELGSESTIEAEARLYRLTLGKRHGPVRPEEA